MMKIGGKVTWARIPNIAFRKFSLGAFYHIDGFETPKAPKAEGRRGKMLSARPTAYSLGHLVYNPFK